MYTNVEYYSWETNVNKWHMLKKETHINQKENDKRTGKLAYIQLKMVSMQPGGDSWCHKKTDFEVLTYKTSNFIWLWILCIVLDGEDQA